MNNSEVFNRLQKLINRLPIQKEIAEKTGINQNTLSAKKARNSKWTEKEIQKLNLAYNIDIYKEISHNITDDCIELDYIHINPSCGRGTVVLDEAEVTPIRIGKEIIQNLWRVSEPKSLKIFQACGDSMEPVIEDGNLLLVDTTRTDCNNGGIFVITINNEWFVKRLRLRITGELDIISDNTKYAPEMLTQDTCKEMIIRGRVIKNLSRGL